MHIHKTVTQKVIEANRKNSNHSHGPTTTRGKRAVRHNAVTHGLLARALVFKHEEEKHSFRKYLRRLRHDLAPADVLESMYVDDLANAEWRLTRATQWEQRVRMTKSRSELVEDALKSGTDKLGIFYFSGMENGGPRCKELTISLTNDKDLETKRHTSQKFVEQPPPYGQNNDSLSGNRGRVELSAKLRDSLDDLDRIVRYQKGIRGDRDNAVDRLLKLKRIRAKANG